MELRYQTQSFFIMLACMFFFVGCGSYQVEGEDEPTDTSGPYGIDVTLSNAQLFTPLYPLHLYFFDTQGTVTWNEEVLTQSEWPVLSFPCRKENMYFLFYQVCRLEIISLRCL